MNFREYLKTCNEVYHTTFDPKQSGVCRIHLVPPKNPKPYIPWTVIINGYSLIPLQSSWAVLLKIFIEHLNVYDNKSIDDEDIDKLIQGTVKDAGMIFKGVESRIFKKDLNDMISTFKEIAQGKEPSSTIGYMTLSKYAKNMKAPHRMDLMVSAMERDGVWNCNQHCSFCYATNEPVSSYKEMTKSDWMKAISKLKDAGIPSITFTGGEATIREDLVDLVAYSSWFVTRLNTNGILLTKELCKKLYDANLDSVQVTFYSSDPGIHNLLVGGNHYDKTVQGIKNALEAGLDVSVNTPLSSLNRDYLSTIKYLENLGVRYFSCSGLIPTGNAIHGDSPSLRLSQDEITKIVKEAYQYAFSKNMEVSFTSPGWINETELRNLKMVVPSCGAAMSNMAIAPNGDVIPCQSWLNGLTFGNILTDKWADIWNNRDCKSIRKMAAKTEHLCLLKKDK